MQLLAEPGLFLAGLRDPLGRYLGGEFTFVLISQGGLGLLLISTSISGHSFINRNNLIWDLSINSSDSLAVFGVIADISAFLPKGSIYSGTSQTWSSQSLGVLCEIPSLTVREHSPSDCKYLKQMYFHYD